MKKIIFLCFTRSLILTVMFSTFSISSFAGAYEEGASALARGDYAAALEQWRLLAKQGDASGQFQLGNMYLDGIGVPQDYAEAVKWYRKAAKQGDAQAQVSLGEMYEQGKGLPQDYAQAYMWFNLAASQFPSVYTERRDNLVKSMTSKQIAEGQRLSRESMPRK